MQKLEARMDQLEQVNAHQTSILVKIQESTEGLVSMWRAAEGAWKLLEGVSKVAKMIIPIVLAFSAIGIAAKSYVSGHFKTIIEALTK